MKILVLLLALTVAAPSAFAQREQRSAAPPGKNQGMSRDERQRLRNDMQDVNRDRNRQERPQRQLSPQERDQLRRDIQDANRSLKR